jgi:hypothetical protein
MLEQMDIRPLKKRDIVSTSEAHKAAFIRQEMSYEYIACNAKAYPKFLLPKMKTKKLLAIFIGVRKWLPIRSCP